MIKRFSLCVVSLLLKTNSDILCFFAFQTPNIMDFVYHHESAVIHVSEDMIDSSEIKANTWIFSAKSLFNQTLKHLGFYRWRCICINTTGDLFYKQYVRIKHLCSPLDMNLRIEWSDKPSKVGREPQPLRQRGWLMASVENGIVMMWSLWASSGQQTKGWRILLGRPVTDAMLGTICLILVLAVISDSNPA